MCVVLRLIIKDDNILKAELWNQKIAILILRVAGGIFHRNNRALVRSVANGYRNTAYANVFIPKTQMPWAQIFL